MNGLGMGVIFFIMFASYALAFWYGAQLMLNEGYSGGSLMIVSTSVLDGVRNVVTEYAELMVLFCGIRHLKSRCKIQYIRFANMNVYLLYNFT